MKTALLVFCYNREEKCRYLLRQIRAYKPRELSVIVVCDGAKGESDLGSVARTRDAVMSCAEELGARIIMRERNYGLSKNITDGITLAMTEFDAVIVLEDDLVIAPLFFRYMLWALSEFEFDSRVMHISGYAFPIDNADALPPFYTLPILSSWGWGTWKSRWVKMIPVNDAKLVYETVTARGAWDQFDMQCKSSFRKMLLDRIGGRSDSWAILWYSALFLANGVALFPRKSLVYNRGFDGSGVHCGSFDLFPTEVCLDEVVFERATIEPNKTAMRMVGKMFNGRFSFHARLYRKLQKSWRS